MKRHSHIWVPTMDTLAAIKIIQLMAIMACPVVLVGPVASGKTSELCAEAFFCMLSHSTEQMQHSWQTATIHALTSIAHFGAFAENLNPDECGSVVSNPATHPHA